MAVSWQIYRLGERDEVTYRIYYEKQPILGRSQQACRKDQTDRDLLEKILVNNLGSSEFFINKAIGWSLRDYSKSNPDWVRRFLERYRNQMNPLSIKEASKYL